MSSGMWWRGENVSGFQDATELITRLKWIAKPLCCITAKEWIMAAVKALRRGESSVMPALWFFWLLFPNKHQAPTHLSTIWTNLSSPQQSLCSAAPWVCKFPTDTPRCADSIAARVFSLNDQVNMTEIRAQTTNAQRRAASLAVRLH